MGSGPLVQDRLGLDLDLPARVEKAPHDDHGRDGPYLPEQRRVRAGDGLVTSGSSEIAHPTVAVFLLPLLVTAGVAGLAGRLMRVLLRDAQAEAETAIRTISQPRQDPYEQLGERVASVIREADHIAETIRGEAHRDAEQVTRQARADADRIRTDAQSKGEEARARADAAVRTAREEADRTIAGLATTP